MKNAWKNTVEVSRLHFGRLFASALLAAVTITTPLNLTAQINAANQQGTADSHAAISRTGELDKLNDLPAAGRSFISASLGADLPAYRVDGITGDLHANTHGMGSNFTPQGVEISQGDARVRLALDAYGHGESLARVTAVPATRVGSNRVEYHHQGVTEWYVNGPLGLEQGFTVENPEKNSSGPLTVALALDGNVTASAEKDGSGVIFSDKSRKEQFEYAGLFSADADGKELPSRMEVDGKRLLIKVTDKGARYPVTIDPYLFQKKWATFGAGYDAGVSVSVSVIGTADYTVVVGAPFGVNPGNGTTSGVAYVFESKNCCTNLTTWRKDTLFPTDGASGDIFGSSVSIDNNPYSSRNGKTIAVGAPKHSAGAGKAYVYVKGGTWWGPANGAVPQNAYMTGAGTPGFAFGSSISMSSNVVVVGEPQPYSCTGCAFGQAYVFQPTVWTGAIPIANVLTLPSPLPNGSEFGFSVGISSSGGGNYPGVVIVGAPQLPGFGGCNCGPGWAYIYNENGANWSTSSSLPAFTLSNPYTTNDWFGFSVSIAIGTWATVGAPNATCNPLMQSSCSTTYPVNTGLAYQFSGLNGWTTGATMVPSDGQTGDLFGFSVATDGKGAPTVVVGSVHHSLGSREGKGYFFQGVWTQTWPWSEVEMQSVLPTGVNAEFGWSVASFQGGSANAAVFGAPESNSYSGAAYLYH